MIQEYAQFCFSRKESGNSFFTKFCERLSKKMFLMLYSINWPNFIFWLPLFFEILGNKCIAIICYPGCDIINFEINLIFLIKAVFLNKQKINIKIWISWEQNKLSRGNKKGFSLLLKNFQLPKIDSDLRIRL